MAEKHFISAQSKRIAEAIEKKYSIKPDFPWLEYPDYGIFRHGEDRKWFALFMNIIPSRLYHKNPAQKARIPAELLAKDELEIVDLKIPTLEIGTLETQAGIFPGYHMNERYWVSVLLEDVLSDAKIMELVEESFQCTGKHGGK